jgi:hypothetical protein
LGTSGPLRKDRCFCAPMELTLFTSVPLVSAEVARSNVAPPKKGPGSVNQGTEKCLVPYLGAIDPVGLLHKVC